MKAVNFIKTVLQFLRPCQRAMSAIEANIEITQQLQTDIQHMNDVLHRIAAKSKPDKDGCYHRRVTDKPRES